MKEFDFQLFTERLQQLLLKRSEQIANETLSTSEEIRINLNFSKELFLFLLFSAQQAFAKPFHFAAKLMFQEMKIYAFLFSLMPIIFIMLGVAWLFFAAWVAAYVYEQGNALAYSIFFSLVVQFVSFIILAAAAYFVFSKSVVKKLWQKFKNIKYPPKTQKTTEL